MTRSNERALLVAVKHNLQESCARLLGEGGVSVHCRNEEEEGGKTPILIAAEQGLANLTKDKLSVVKSYTTPPGGVDVVLNAVVQQDRVLRHVADRLLGVHAARGHRPSVDRHLTGVLEGEGDREWTVDLTPLVWLGSRGCAPGCQGGNTPRARTPGARGWGGGLG